MRLLFISLLALTFGSVLGCKEWCFEQYKCFPPDKSDCARCISYTCYHDFYYPFGNYFGSSCVKHALLTCCHEVCGYPDYYEVETNYLNCKECLTPCVEEATAVQEECFPPPQPDEPIEVQIDPLCSDCVGPSMCFNLTEQMMVDEFCLGYISLSCGHIDVEEMGIDMKAVLSQMTQDVIANKTRSTDGPFYPPELLKCVVDAFKAPCSKCPPLNATRIYNCGMCINECIPKAYCALQCSITASGPHVYPINMPCLPCSDLCEVTMDEENCEKDRCRTCSTCDKCYRRCGADPGIIKNTCRCRLGYYAPVSLLYKK